MLAVKLISLFFAFFYVASLQFVVGETARDIIQFNALVVITSIMVRIFGDIYYISKETESNLPVAFRISVYDFAVIGLVTPILILTGWEPYGAPPLLAGLIITVYSLSIITARYLQRTGAPRIAFLFISVPYFCLASPVIIIIGEFSYELMLVFAVAHLCILISIIIYRNRWHINLETNLELPERLQRSGALFTGAIINQGGLFLIAETLQADQVADIALYYRIAALMLIPLMTFSMGQQIKMIDERHALQFETLHRNYRKYVHKRLIILIGTIFAITLVLVAMLFRGAPVSVLVFITIYYLLNVASGPAVFFTVISTRHGLLTVATLIFISACAYGTAKTGVSGAAVMAIGYGLFLLNLFGIMAQSGRLLELRS